MTTEELENSLREAAEVRLAAIDDSAVHAAADRACAGRAPQHSESRPDRPAPAKPCSSMISVISSHSLSLS